MRDTVLATDDGRRLGFVDLGDPDGACVCYCHGAPSCRLALVPFDQDFRAQGLRVLAADRPGYGASSPRPGRTLAQWPADVVALLDAAGVERAVVVGHSSGGPYALACAALAPDRVAAVVVVAGSTDPTWTDAWDGFDPLELELMRAPDEATALARAVERCGPHGERFLEASTLDPSAPDLAFLTDPVLGAALAAHLAESFRQGIGGYAQDVFVQGRPWPFDPASILARVLVVHGDADSMVPLAHSRHTAEVIPGAELVVAAGHGHLSITRELPLLLASVVKSDLEGQD
ncbi:MAG: alpha/beta hydrolase [Acidimicrobiales bacterium]|jgi:pimeloyl-ACP methyl ester carboxylesterase|nr:alpha/beta hydrolase [Acidimicrobiales bacterium]